MSETAESEQESDWKAAMRAGDFARAWAITDRDLASLPSSPKHTGPRHLQRIWRGEPLAGRRVLVRCYHGLGDTIQFVRFLPALRGIAAQVILWCQPELVPLMQTVRGVDRLLPLHDGTPDAVFDVDIEIMEIPHAIRADRNVVTAPIPYLMLQAPACTDLAADRGRLSVGLVWECGNWDKRRSIPAAVLGALKIGGVDLYSLQLEDKGAAARIGAKDISTPDIVQLAQRLSALDLVITVDTMVAHLAGALGVPAWVLLHADCDWRWPSSGERSLWYPSLRLFHQRKTGDWTGVLAAVQAALRTAQRSGLHGLDRTKRLASGAATAPNSADGDSRV